MKVKINEQVLPVGKVGISGKAVAMGKEQTHTICAAMPSHTHSGAIHRGMTPLNALAKT
jgi:hypothetical protein